ncbi:hypothetical protein C8R47DRAFT_1152642 [Mycena vitilis]|nr:hypothetical protein C8R47DRAFT_1152642 [Mycena vitilis]
MLPTSPPSVRVEPPSPEPLSGSIEPSLRWAWPIDEVAPERPSQRMPQLRQDDRLSWQGYDPAASQWSLSDGSRTLDGIFWDDVHVHDNSLGLTTTVTREGVNMWPMEDDGLTAAPWVWNPRGLEEEDVLTPMPSLRHLELEGPAHRIIIPQPSYERRSPAYHCVRRTSDSDLDVVSLLAPPPSAITGTTVHTWSELPAQLDADDADATKYISYKTCLRFAPAGIGPIRTQVRRSKQSRGINREPKTNHFEFREEDEDTEETQQ